MNRLLTAFALFAAGCHSSISIDQYFNDTSKTECEFIVKCCGGMQQGMTYATVDDCVAANSNAQELAALKAEIKAGTLKYDGAAASSCLDAERSLTSSCTNTETASTVRHIDSSCQNIIVGTAKVGAACNPDELACAPGAYCDTSVSMSSTSGTCTALLKSGQDCSNGYCDANLYCDDMTLKCTALKSKGSACTSDDQCSSGDCSSTCVDPAPVPVTDFCANANAA